MDNKQPSAYELSAREVLASCINADKDTIAYIIHGTDLKINDLPKGQYRTAFGLLLNDFEAGLTPSPTSLYGGSNKELNLEWLRGLEDQSVKTDKAINAAQKCKGYAVRASTQTVLNDSLVQNLDMKNNPTEIRNDAIRDLSKVGDSTVKNNNMPLIWKEIMDARGQGQQIPYSTNIHWLDHILKGGLRRGRHIAIGAPEKMRKSTWMRNVVLGVLQDYENGVSTPRDNVHVVVLNFENDRHITMIEFLCMVTMQLMWDDPAIANGLYNGKPRHLLLDPELIQTKIDDSTIMEYFDKITAKLFGEARGILGRTNLVVYDKTRDGGHLRTLDDVWRIARTYRALYTKPEDFVVYVIDHLHLVDVPNVRDKNDKVDAVARSIKDIPDDLNAMLITLAQFNRQAKWNKHAKDEIDVMGTSGSSALEQDVQNYMDTQYDGVESPDKLTVRMRRSRRSGGGLDMKQDFLIHPQTGAVLGMKATTSKLKLS
jgi:hypothetical protein